MENNENQLKKRLSELAERSESRGGAVYSDFLNISEQDILYATVKNIPYKLFGGYDGAERKMACFGNFESIPPAVWICISPTLQKFADVLSHRDFLGSLMGLGIKRETLGDIIVNENRGYLYCSEKISNFVLSEFKQVRHTAIFCEIIKNPPVETVQPPEKSELVVPSERLDAVVAAVYRLSRSESQALFAEGKIYINGRLTENTTHCPENGDIISARGIGRFIYEGIERETKKGRLRVSVRIY
ncbi:MAG: YlmH/Sll1252 family protein [Clostridia bacterium]